MICKNGPCGGDGGEPFSIDNPDMITSIVKIRVDYSTCIHAITMTYIADGVQKSTTWGGVGGNSSETGEFALQPGEYITCVKGRYGRTPEDNWNGVRALIFETNNTTHEPYAYGINVGAEWGTEFELCGEMTGLFGLWDGIGLGAIGLYIKVGDTGGSTGTGKYRNF